MSFDFLNREPTGVFAPNNINGVPMPMPTMQQNIPQQQVPVQQAPAINPIALETPKIVSSGNSFFSVIKDGSSDTALIPVDNGIVDGETEAKKRRGRPRKDSAMTDIVRGSDTSPAQSIEDIPTAYTYIETTNMLRDTLGQIDSLNMELMQEFENIKHNRTMKNKYQVMVGISENVGALISNKISAIREINSSISKSNDMDYKKDKDRRAATAAMDDDKYIADLYRSFIQNPMNNAPQVQLPQVDPAIFGSSIVRADLKSGDYAAGGPVDVGYLSYLSNMSPEQNLMRYEGNSNVKQVVVYDASSGNKFFQMMDMSTGQVIPNVPVYDQMFMEDTTIDLNAKIARNTNLNEIFPLVIINEGVTNQY